MWNSDTTRSLRNAFVRWSAPELGTNLGQSQIERNSLIGQLFEMNGGLGRD